MADSTWSGQAHEPTCRELGRPALDTAPAHTETQKRCATLMHFKFPSSSLFTTPESRLEGRPSSGEACFSSLTKGEGVHVPASIHFRLLPTLVKGGHRSLPGLFTFSNSQTSPPLEPFRLLNGVPGNNTSAWVESRGLPGALARVQVAAPCDVLMEPLKGSQRAPGLVAAHFEKHCSRGRSLG